MIRYVNRQRKRWTMEEDVVLLHLAEKERFNTNALSEFMARSRGAVRQRRRRSIKLRQGGFQFPENILFEHGRN